MVPLRWVIGLVALGKPCVARYESFVKAFMGRSEGEKSQRRMLENQIDAEEQKQQPKQKLQWNDTYQNISPSEEE